MYYGNLGDQVRQTLLVILGYEAIGCRDVCVSNSDIGVGERICNEFILQKALSIQREEQCTGEIAVADVELVFTNIRTKGDTLRYKHA